VGAVSGYNADVWITAAPSIPVTNEVCTDISPGTGGASFQTSVHKRWDKHATLTVQTSVDGTSWSTDTTLNQYFQWVSGIFLFPNRTLVGMHVRVSGSYFNASQVPECHTWELSVISETQDTTIFQMPWKRYTPTTKHATGKIATFIVDDTLSSQVGGELIFVLYADTTAGASWQFYGHLLQADPKVDVNAVINDDVSFISDGQVIFYASGS
jgi:hypothetical protein